jgi:hypothetical protein
MLINWGQEKKATQGVRQMAANGATVVKQRILLFFVLLHKFTPICTGCRLYLQLSALKVSRALAIHWVY